MKSGSKVTLEPSRFYDGQPNLTWPNPQFIGTVVRLLVIRGVPYAKVRNDFTGRTDIASLDDLTTINARTQRSTEWTS